MPFLLNFINETFYTVCFCHFHDLISTTNGGAINFINQSNKNIYLFHNIFINNKCERPANEGGAIYLLIDWTSCEFKCNIFSNNFASYSPSFFISSAPNVPEALKFSQTLICDESGSSHLDIVSGNPLDFNNNNITENNSKMGFVIHYAQKGNPSAIYFVNFVRNTCSDGYFIYDQEIMPENYQTEKSSFINNSINKFFSERQSSLSKEPIFISSNFIFNDIIPTFNMPIKFKTCFFSVQKDLLQPSSNIDFIGEIQTKQFTIIISNIDICFMTVKCLQSCQNQNPKLFLAHNFIPFIILSS